MPYPLISLVNRLPQDLQGQSQLNFHTRTFETFSLTFRKDYEASDVFESVKGLTVASELYGSITLTFLRFGQLVCHIYMPSSTPQIHLFLPLMDGRYTLPARNTDGWEWDPDPKHGGSQISTRTMRCVFFSLSSHTSWLTYLSSVLLIHHV